MARETMIFDKPKLRIIGVVEGHLTASDGLNPVELTKGHFCLLPAGLPFAQLSIDADTSFLLVEPGSEFIGR